MTTLRTLAALALTAMAFGAHAEYPDKAITFVVPFAISTLRASWTT